MAIVRRDKRLGEESAQFAMQEACICGRLEVVKALFACYPHTFVLALINNCLSSKQFAVAEYILRVVASK